MNKVHFHEALRFKVLIGWIIIIPLACLFWYVFYMQVILGHPVGSKPMPNGVAIVALLIFGIGMPALLFIKPLKVEITEQEVKLRFIPFYSTKIQIQDIQAIHPTSVSPIGEYGGWGVRKNMDSTGLITKKGNAVKLELVNNKVIVISTDKQEDWIKIIEQLRNETD